MPAKKLAHTDARRTMLERIEAGHVSVTRNGAQEPSVRMSEGPQVSSHARAFTTLWALYEARFIRFAERGMFGTPLGAVTLTERGTAQLASWRESFAK